MLAIIQTYIAQGIVTLYNSDIICEERSLRQPLIYQTYSIEALRDSKWLAIVDLDEFLYSPHYTDIKEAIQTFDTRMISHILVDWVPFGSNGYIEQPKNVVESFTRRAQLDDKTRQAHPSLFSYKSSDSIQQDMINVHEPSIRPLPSSYCNWIEADMPMLLINHYQTQSENFWKIKSSRGDVNRYISEMLATKKCLLILIAIRTPKSTSV